MDQAQLLAALSPEKRKLLERKLAAGGFGTFPVSFSQQRLWFLQQLEPESSLYNIPLVTRFRGELDASALERAIQTVMQRHEVLRTGFIAVNGTPFQKVHKELAFALPIFDISAETEVEQRVRDFAVKEWRQPFDLSKPPLFRAALLKVSAGEHVLVIILHHIITDGWSNGILLREVAALYAAFVQQKPSPLPPLEFQYAEYANWQRKFLSGGQFETQLAFWKEHLAQAPPHLDLPTDRPRPAFQSNRGADYFFDFPVDLSQRLKAFCTAQGTTLFMTLLAAFQLLLRRYSGQERISVGTPIANRTKKQFESLIGFFVNTLVMHTDLSGNPSFVELVQRVKATTLGAYAHQDMPFERLVEALQPERDPSYTPLFQVMFVLQNKAGGTISLPGVEVSAVELPKEASTFDLTLGVAETETGLTGSIEYTTDLFEKSTVARLAEHLLRLLDFALRAPETPIDAIPLINDAERRLIVGEWNNTDRDVEQDACIHHLFEAQVERTPEAVAVVGRNRRLTYRQLNERANQLAHRLIAQGVSADDVVAVSVARSPEMIVSLLAVLKTGAAYLPLDPDYPSERIAFMLADARVKAMIAQDSVLPHIPGNLPLFPVNDPRLDDAPMTNPDAPVDPLNIAYVIYTSGSTGTPKGVMVPHRAAVNHNLAAIADYQLTAADRVLQFSSINFDAAVEEIFPTLMCGATLVLRDAAPVQTVAEILHLAETEAVTVLDFPTAYWHQVVHELNAGLELPASVRICLIGGEKASPERFAVWQKMTGARLVNTYGPTETAVVSTIFEPAAGFDPSSRATLPIGRPIQNVYNYVLDRQLNPVPVGVAGELYTGGKGVTRGYLNRPDLTAAVFLPDPFSRRPGALMYKTGDLVRLAADGVVEYLGRVDFQVKVRGFRIELGEVEAALLQHASVRECAVVARAVSAVETELIAFVGGAEADEAELRAFLKERLPGYMMPAQFVIRPSLPKTAGGKIDKRALPIPEIRASHIPKTPPRTPTEQKLAPLFAELLRIPAVGVEDDFFQLGGHSLIATQLASRVRDAFGIELPLRELFVEPTVAHLAQVIDEMVSAKSGNGRPPIRPAPSGVEKPLSFAQQRMWFLDQLEPGSAQYNIPDAVRIRGQLDAEVLRRALQAIVQRHEVLRTAFPTVDGKPRLDVLPALDVDFPLIDLSSLPADERERRLERLILETAQKGFDLSRAPLFRLRLIRLADDEHVLASAMHHIISDGWSFAVLINETATLYSRLRRGDSTPLPPLTIQYSDFALWQRNWLKGEVLEEELDFWRKQLEDAPVLALPTDRPRPAFMTTNGAHLSFSLSEATTRALNELCRKQGVTPFMALLAAFKVFLYRCSRQRSISVGSPVANRTGREIESLIGFFVNTLVLRTDLSGSPTFLELLKRVQETTVSAFAHQDVPFEKIVDALQPQRDTGHSPLFQVMFLLQNIPSPGRAIEGLAFESLAIETRTSNFDLTLVMEEQAGRLLGGFEYNTDLFNESTVQRMARHFSALVESIVTAPEQSIDRLNMMSADESFQVIFGWNDTGADYGAGVIHELIAQQVQKTPEAIAVKMGERTLTYGELDAAANQLARHLVDFGVQGEEIVGLCVERSPEMIVALLGILKAGAAYLPLDPAYPPERIRFMIDDARVRVVLTQQRLQEIFSTLQVRTMNLDDASRFGSASAEPPEIAVSPLNLAYVIYTSGSTGLPKGVQVTHQGVVNHNNVIRREYGFTPNDRVLQFFSLNFDGAVEEIFPTLMSGATLVLRPEGRVLAVDELLALAAAERLTVFDLPTAYWHELAFELEHYQKKLPDSVRLLLTGGEAASPERYALWQKNVGENVQWLNTYGPTEGTVIASIYDPAADPNREPATMPIGRPLANVRLYVLDSQLDPTPVGVPGELCIGGVGVARGYLNRPDLTAKKFVPDPFSGVEGARLYRTGDLALWREDGNVMFIGRADDQVKIRGFRIELGEIEAALLRFAGIREAVVTARRDGGTEEKLAAYVVTESAQLDFGVLRAFLKERLPDYMIPHAIVPLESLPRLISGKIDRKALPKPEFVAGDEGGFAEPVGEIEQKLAEIFKDILGVERVGRHDNFFERGGDSIMSIQVIAKAGQAGIRLTPKQLFEAPTPAGLAELAGKGVMTVAEQETLTGEVALTPIQKWFFEQRFAEPHHWNQSLLFALGQPLDVEALRRALAKIVDHHDALRLRFSPEGNRAFYVERETHDVLKTFDLRALAEAERRTVIESECARLQTSFDLHNGPLFIAGYFDMGDEARLFLAAHHLVMDGVSWRILLEDIQSAYGQAAAGAEIRLPAKTTSWRYWAGKLDEYVGSAAAQGELEYWTHYERQLAARLPVDFPEGAAQNVEETAERLGVELSAEQTRTLLQEILAEEKVQINDVLLAALTQALAAWSGKRAFLVEMEGHGRESLFEEVNLARTVGWFTTVFPLFVKSERGASAKETVRSISAMFARLPHHGIGYGLLRQGGSSEIREKLAALPAAEIAFNYLGQFDQLTTAGSPFKPAAEHKGAERSPHAQRTHLLEVTAVVSGGRLRIEWEYSRVVHRLESVRELATHFTRALEEIIEGGDSAAPQVEKISKIDQRQLGKVLGQLNKGKGKSA